MSRCYSYPAVGGATRARYDIPTLEGARVIVAAKEVTPPRSPPSTEDLLHEDIGRIASASEVSDSFDGIESSSFSIQLHYADDVACVEVDPGDPVRLSVALALILVSEFVVLQGGHVVGLDGTTFEEEGITAHARLDVKILNRDGSVVPLGVRC